MGCKYIDQCPSADGWCNNNVADYKKCVQFLVTAYESVKKELQEYRNTRLSPNQIRELKEIQKIIPDGYTPDDIRTAQQLAGAGEIQNKREGNA